jgi:uncharacterized protein YfaS (alpha-2-macroglobulin family)
MLRSTTFRSTLLFSAIFLAALPFLSGCKSKSLTPSDDSLYGEFIGAYTAGQFSRGETIKIVFQEGALREGVNQKIDPKWLAIDPEIEGELRWLNDNTLEFIPSAWMPSGTPYMAQLNLGELTRAEGELKNFIFGWRTLDQYIQTEVTGIGAYDDNHPEFQFVTGVLSTNDLADNEGIEAVLEAKQNGKKLSISWRHEDPKTHIFTIDSVVRGVSAYRLDVMWNGKPIGCDQEGGIEQNIPGLEDFEVMGVRLVQEPDQHLVVLMSDPIDGRQDLRGQFILDGSDDLRIVAERNEVHLYPNYRITGTATLEIRNTLKNRYGYILRNDYRQDVTFESLKPAVRIHDEGKSILPSGNKNTIAFDAVSLSAVDVRVIQVFGNNMNQFLQTNGFDGESELKRVGRVIKRKTIQLTAADNKDLGQWNRFYLSLDEFIKADPGSLYRIEIGFRAHHSLFPCDDVANQDEEPEMETNTDNWDSDGEEENSFWDYFDSWYYSGWYDGDEYYYDYDYNYEDRENPCKSLYYRQNRFAARNIFATDVALIAKRGENGTWSAWASNIMTTAPLSGVTLQWMNYQGQVMHAAVTDANGFAAYTETQSVPFILTAALGKQKSYLKLNSGENLSLSAFDVSGSATTQGMKGFIYGERGVWRPGDTLFLSFMLEEGDKPLPGGHPVTLEIVDSRGKVVFKNNKNLPSSKVLTWDVTTDDEAPTGSWQARVRVGGAVFNQWLRIETIKPNRLKVALDFGSEVIRPSARQGQNPSLNGSITAQWLHGAPAKNLRAQVDLALKPKKTTFAKYADFTFDDPTRSVDMEGQTVFDGNLDREGFSKIALDLRDLSDAPGMLNAVLNTRVYEPGGDFSVDVLTQTLSPFDAYVGLRLPKGDKARGMLLTDTTHTVDVRSVDADGKSLPKRALNYSVYKVEWRWWWQSGADDLSSYSGRTSMNLINSGTCTTDAKGNGKFNFRINYPEWGRYLVHIEDQESGHAAGQTMYVDWPGWAGRAQRENPEGETMVMMTSDKDVYQPGQSATISFPGADNARALITVENASSILRSWWITTKAGSNSFALDIQEQYAPNVYVSVTLVQPHAQTMNDKPIRMYGTLRLKVEDPTSRLEPVIAMAESLEPESKYTVKVSEGKGQKMTYTLAVVDEGLLGLTRFKTPDPHAYFYAQEALGVRTWDLYDQVIGAYGDAMRKALTTGGDAAIDSEGKKKVNRFKPVVSFLGPFTVEAGKSLTHNLSMPNYVGAVRVMVVARQGDAYGNAEKIVQVKKPLMVLATLPRVLAPGEEVALPVNVFAMDKSIKDVEIEVKHNGKFTAIGDAKKSIRFATLGDEVVNFILKVGDEEGAARVEVTARSGSQVARYTVDLEVRNPNPPVTVRYAGTLEAGGTWSQAFDLPGTKGSNSLHIEVSSFKPLNLGDRLNYLIGYPHGCLEQTTSRAFPQLYLEDAVEMNEQEKTRVRQHITAAVQKLQGFQLANGGFSYWPGQSNYNDWSSTYAGHFLVEAKQKGYAVPDGVLSRWAKHQDELARNWRYPSSAEARTDNGIYQAYRLYTLALYGQANLGAMNRLREVSNLSAAAKAQLAAAYVLAGRQDVANQILAAKLDDPGSLTSDYGSPLRDRAVIASALISANQRKLAAPIVSKLVDEMNRKDWLSTQESAFVLIAIGRFLKTETKEAAAFSYTYNGAASGDQQLSKPSLLKQLKISKLTGNQLAFTNRSKRTLYVEITAQGQPKEDKQGPANNGLVLDVRYLDNEGKPMRVDRIEQGTDFIAAVTVKTTANKRHLRDIALTQVFPSGWEILNERMLEASGQSFTNSPSDYRDLRDDRIMTYFNLNGSATATFYVRLNAAYLGRFYLPANAVELMYDASMNARTQGMWVEVVQTGGV